MEKMKKPIDIFERLLWKSGMLCLTCQMHYSSCPHLPKISMMITILN